MRSLVATFANFTTTYTIDADDPDDPLGYSWSMVPLVAHEACGDPHNPWTQGATVSWEHSGPANGGDCTHVGTNHAATLSVTVFEGGRAAVVCGMQGTNPQTINKPPCQVLPR